MFIRLQVAAFSRRVLFTAAAAAVPAGALLLEVGPHSLLRGPLRQCAALGTVHYLLKRWLVMHVVNIETRNKLPYGSMCLCNVTALEHCRRKPKSATLKSASLQP